MTPGEGARQRGEERGGEGGEGSCRSRGSWQGVVHLGTAVEGKWYGTYDFVTRIEFLSKNTRAGTDLRVGTVFSSAR